MVNQHKTNIFLAVLLGLVAGVCLCVGAKALMKKTSTNEYCMSCHYHPDSDASWRQSEHCFNGSGVMTECVACHLPEEGTVRYVAAKTKTGMKDLWSYWTKEPEEIDWASKKDIEHAVRIVYNESCKACHVDLYPQGIVDEGITAHLYYEEKEKDLDLQCISCHQNVGHYNPDYSHARMSRSAYHLRHDNGIFESPATLESFSDFVETIPGTSASISMKAIPGGTFIMGSPEDEPFRNEDEGPAHSVTVSSFFMGEFEVTWDQYWSFFTETMSEGRTPPEVVYANNTREDVDAVSGPTPPFGAPDQGWGMGDRPAITMTHYGAETFCQWLSLKTGRKYRLPTEAEWEYAARGGTQTPYFFEGNPRKFSEKGFLRSIFKADTTGINSYVVYSLNSKNRTKEPSEVGANPFGLRNMLGNVLEYCSDYYAGDAYSHVQDGALDPKGPESGEEFVVRGGQYSDGAENTRCAARSHTEHNRWLKTDPQNPKSIWWYSDMKGIGFRVVCEVPEGLNN